ncbi:MAG TPA: DUF711 family protein [Anaerolineae bacterium]|nr:DUF711 family protein [Anaerolineae bacterium]
MKIRAITLFTPLNWPFDMATIVSAGRFLHAAKDQLEEAGYTVQTLRLATPPFMDLLGDPAPSALEDFVVKLEQRANQQGIDFISIGPVMATTPLSHLQPVQAIPTLIAKTQTIFATVQTASAKTGINLAAIQATAQAVHKIGQITPNGFGNLRFAMLANVAPRGPFFPGAYHDGINPAFGLAMEAADLAVSALQNAQTLAEGQKTLIAAFNEHGARLQNIIDLLVDEHNIHFSGIDFSLAPYPESATSIGAAMEHLGVDAFGGHGTLFATAFLTNCIKQADIPRAGYSGVMLPVLEDKVLAQRSLDHTYTINDLLLYSAVCGAGLDTIPIPGDTSPEQIAGLLLDVATLAVSLNKPLSARLMPVPGLKAGDITNFDFEYFANSAVLPLKSKAAAAIFAKNSFYSF